MYAICLEVFDRRRRMKFYPLKCPQCGATIDVEEGRRTIFCQYCGSKIFIDDEVKRSEVTHVIHDEARIQEVENVSKEIDLEREWQENRRKSIRRWSRFCIALFIIGGLVFLISFLTGHSLDDDEDFWVLFVGIFSIEIGAVVLIYGGLGYFISLLVHNKRRNKHR